MVKEILGTKWLNNEWFRFGASSLANEVLMQLVKIETEVYQSNDYANNWKGESPSGSIGLSDKLPAGTYYYVVNLVNSGIKPIQGYILLGTENR